MYGLIPYLVLGAAALISALIAGALTRKTRGGVLMYWVLLLAIGAVVYWLGEQAVGHMAGLGHAVFLLVVWTPAVIGGLIGSWIGWRGRPSNPDPRPLGAWPGASDEE